MRGFFFAGYNLSMPRVRRTDDAARLEIMPLLDVVFLLLTFFIYSFVVMIRADALSVDLAPVTTGSRPVGEVAEVLTIDADGALRYDGRTLDDAALDTLLTDLAADPAGPTLYVTLTENGNVDRAPLLWQLDERVRRAGLERYVKVGPPGG